jgi:putative phosphoesterase
LRLAILADTHMPRGSRRLSEVAMAELRRADLIIHLGDFGERSVLEEISALGPPVEAVHGNIDSAELRDLLPAEKVIEVEGVSIALVHDGGPARGRLERLRRRFSAADVVLFGHSHLPLHERRGRFQIFNPGSPTERRRAPSRTIGVGRATDGQLRLRHVIVD